MSDARSDALVFFGATGDLAYKKIFPAHTWGPQEVDSSVSPPRGWQNPTVRLP